MPVHHDQSPNTWHRPGWFIPLPLTQVSSYGNVQFVTMDAEHLKYLLVTGYTNFSRGDTQKELLSVHPNLPFHNDGFEKN